MEGFKIEHFKTNHKVEFPVFNKVSGEICEYIRRKISQDYNIGTHDCSVEFVVAISDNQSILSQYNAEKDFNLLRVLRELGIEYNPKVYINWYRFDNIDQMDINDLSQYFDDIWYPASDDVDLFDDNLAWILSIRHDGIVSMVKYSAQL